MPDENERTGVDEEDLPETSLHAHGSGVEEEVGDERPRAEQMEGGVPDEDTQDADQVENTGGATSGGPPSDEAGEDPSDVAGPGSDEPEERGEGTPVG